MNPKVTWHSKDYDIPVEVIKYLGEKQGEHWVLVRSGSVETGVPLRELKIEESEE